MTQKLLLLSCCAPCSCAVIKTLAQQGRDVTVLFCNPNIAPVAEYEKRRAENERVCQLYGVPFVALAYHHAEWLSAVRGLENEPERGRRCDVCFEMRLTQACQYALDNGFDAVASVLGVPRYKDLAQVNRAAARASSKTGVPYELIEGRKGGMQALRQSLIEELSLYRQNYCGCPFSSRQ